MYAVELWRLEGKGMGRRMWEFRVGDERGIVARVCLEGKENG